MTFSPHASAFDGGAFDTGPLSWVIGEIRGALERSGSALNDAATRSTEAQPTLLLHAKTHLHQAHGALQMVDVDGVGLLTAAAERALDGFKDRSLDCTPESAKTVREAYGAIVEYLDELLAGVAPQPVRLFPYYRALQELLGAERIHPSDLLAVDTGVALALPDAPDAPAPNYALCRAQFEKALLPYLKSPDAAAQRSHAGALRAAIAPLADAGLDAHARTFWSALRSVAGLVADGTLPGDLYVKQLFGQINLQLRRLAQGQAGLPEALLRDALFFVAAAPAAEGEAAMLRQAFRLQDAVPSDYAERRYGKVDPGALREAKEALARAQSGWDQLALQPDPAREAEFGAALATLADAGAQLGAPALAQLLRELAQAADVSNAPRRADGFALEMAGALLFAEQGLDHVRQLPDDFAEHARLLGRRLLALAAGDTPPDAPSWQNALTRRIQQGQTVAALAGEIKSGLRQVEKLLDEYYDAPQAQRGALERAAPLLHQVQGALSILDQAEAARAAQHVREAVQALAEGDGDVQAQAATLHNIARNIGALGFFTDMLAQDNENARSRFAFDGAAGLLLELSYEQAAQAGAVQHEPAPAPAPVPAAEPEPEPEPSPAAAIDAELLEIFILEAEEVLGTVAATLPALAQDPADQGALTTVRRAFHTLKGSARMVDLEVFAAASAALERTLNLWLADARAATPDLLALVEYAHGQLAPWVAELAQAGNSGRDGAELVAAAERVQAGGSLAEPAQADEPAEPAAPEDGLRRVGPLEIPLALYNIYVAETDELVRLLERDFGQWREEPGRPVSEEALTAVHTLAGTSATVGFAALRDLAYSVEDTLGMLAAPAAAQALQPGRHEVFDKVLAGVRRMLAAFARGELAPAPDQLLEQLDALRAELAGQQAAAAYGDVAPALAQELDSLFAEAYDSLVAEPPLAIEPPPQEAQAAPTAPQPAGEPFGLDLDALFDAPQAEPEPELVEPEPEPAPAAFERPLALPAAPVLALEPVPHDELDPDLLPVFLEEAADLLPQIGNALRQWQQDPQDSAPAQGLLRTLHTVKGSARMAGAMRIGQHTHELETQVENMVHAGTTAAAAFDELMANYDQALALFEQLVQPAQAIQAADEATDEAEDGALRAAPVADAAEPALPPEARTPLVRVRADILDRLVTQAGEVSIARSRLENQVGVLKGSLTDLSDHLARLRRQLREVEMQAESQIASRMSIAGEREFDPLEFDRFTRLQELTRMMAESVNDVASFHESLSRTVDGAGEELAAQSRMTRDLQRDLMRVRMVPFGSLSERLFRVARQTAKETDKRVNLDIRGGAVEIDRSVLEQMAAPFEHLLRNAIVHGIEARAARLAAGKPETGELLVQVSQQGNEVVLQFSDDGAGLDLERIRAKARQQGLAAEDAALPDAEAAELIFTPGFSTADTLTELAGRGVGMDVVRSEAQSLGGRVAIATEAGKGVRFTIRLPLTLAVTQVVLVASGAKTYALPSTLVEQVAQVREADLIAAADANLLEVAGQVLAFHYLPALLGEGETFEPGQRSRPVMVLHSAGERIALQVDEVLGNREVVIKNLGPQLARVPGIAGATVLGSGDIVLILNPLALGRHAGSAAPAAAAASPQRPTVLVVDDSITVRRVTQRLLEREGYRVALAKDGVDALAQLPEVRPDLMLVDIEMPRMDGFDLVRHVRNDAATSAIPIIMITSRTADKHRNVALGLGVNAYFGKPYQEPVLLGAIAGLLNREMPAAQ